jgi:hypothetical protein
VLAKISGDTEAAAERAAARERLVDVSRPG